MAMESKDCYPGSEDEDDDDPNWLMLGLAVFSIVAIIVVAAVGRWEGYRDGYKAGYEAGVQIRVQELIMKPVPEDK